VNTPPLKELVRLQNIDDITALISISHDKMSVSHRRIAAYLLEHPDDVALCSMREIAGRLKMDPSTFVRFAKKLSFSGYAELRDIFRKELRAARTGYMERARQLQKKGGRGEIVELVSDLRLSNEVNLHQLFEKNQPGLLQRAAENMLRARHIYVVGMRSCFSAAFALHYACRMIRRRVYLGDGLAGTFADGMRGMGPGDVFVVIGTHPYSRDTALAAGYAAQCGATIIALTDSKLSPLAVDAEFTLVFGHRGPLILGTIVPAMALVEILVAVMIARGGEKALDTLKESDQQLTKMSSYVREAPLRRSSSGQKLGESE
jgi:DNA-binding MurR/RpiR family transcriptional regulator